MTRCFPFRYVVFIWLAGQVFMMGVIEGFGGPLHFPPRVGHAFGNGIGFMDMAVFVAWLLCRIVAVRDAQ